MLQLLKKKGLEKSLELRSLIYYLESLPLIHIEQWIRFQTLRRPELVVSEKELAKEVRSLIKEDVALISKNQIPLSILNFDKPLTHAKRLAKIYLDSVEVNYRKKFNLHKSFSKNKTEISQELPDYYTRNFHNQTDGYLSSKSAELYEHQVELLFRGSADAMRRLMLKACLKSIKDSPDLNLIETGCGTGVSTKILSAVFPQAQIKAYDLSTFYIEKAKVKNPSANLEYKKGNAENLKEIESNSVDAYFSTFMFHELPKAKREEVLTEAYRILKPHGKIFIVDSLQEHDREDFKEVLRAFPQNFHEPYYKNYIESPMEEFLEGAGFSKVGSDHKFLSKVLWAEKST